MQHFTIITLFLLLAAQTNYAQDTTKAQKLPEVTIEAKKAVPERLTDVVDGILFSGKKNEVIKLANIDANLVNNNSRQVFARVPGISIFENDASGAQIAVGARGLNPNRSWEFNTRQNGYDISGDIFGYPEAYYNPPLEAVEKIQIVRGGASLQFGAQFGGLLNYVLKTAPTDRPFTFQSQVTVGSYGMLSAFNAIGGNTSKISYYAYNHYRKGNSWRENSRYEIRNTHGMVKYKINDNNSISAEYTNMDYTIQQPGGLTETQFNANAQQSNRRRNWLTVPWNLAAINFDSRINTHFSFNLKVFGLLGERSSIGFIAAPDLSDTVNVSLKDYNNRQIDRDFYKNIAAEWRGIYQYRWLGQAQNLAFGARASQSNTTRNQRGKGSSNTDLDLTLLSNRFATELEFQTNNVALFAENQIRVSEKLSITPGIRYENISSTIAGLLTTTGSTEVTATPNTIKRSVVLGGIGLEYKMKTSSVYSNLSQAFRPVLFSDITPPATNDVIDPNLKDATGWNFDLGYRGTVANYLSFDASVFYLQYNDRIGTVRRFLNDDPTKSTYQLRTNLGKSANKGIEAYADFNFSKALKMNHSLGNMSVFASLAFIDATYDEFKTTTVSGTAPNIVLVEGTLKNKKVEYAPSQIHSIGLTYARQGFSSTLQTRISSDVFSDANNTETPNTTGTIGQIKGYQVYDFSLEYKFLQYFNIRLNINNLTNLQYATRRSNGSIGGGILPSEGRTLNLGIGVKF
jgi:Fe(3+) dicitrate transport protein